jgi:hypothetical protein
MQKKIALNIKFFLWKDKNAIFTSSSKTCCIMRCKEKFLSHLYLPTCLRRLPFRDKCPLSFFIASHNNETSKLKQGHNLRGQTSL